MPQAASSNATNMAAPAGFGALLAAYPWPDVPPRPGAPLVGRDATGFDLLTKAISDRSHPTVVMEIGAEFGGSTRRFLSVPNAWVISVDPWPDSYGGGSFPEIQSHLGSPGAMYELFQTYCWEYRDRLVGVREWSPAGPLEVRDAGVQVDFIYIDGDHRYDAVLRDLTVCDSLFPDAALCGDDWTFQSSPKNTKKYEGMQFPTRQGVLSWAAFRNYHVEVDGNTWMIDRNRPFNFKKLPPRFSKIEGSASTDEPSKPTEADLVADRLSALDKLSALDRLSALDKLDVLEGIDARLTQIEQASQAPSIATRIVDKGVSLAKQIRDRSR